MIVLSQPWLVFRADQGLFTRHLLVSHNNNHETPNGPTTFGSIFSHTVGSWWSGPALDMSCHEPNTWAEKIGSRFRVQIVSQRARIRVELCRLLVAKTIPKTSSQAIPGGSVGPRRLPSCALRLTPCGSALPLSTAAFLSYPGELWTLAEKCGSPERSRLPNIARNLRLLRNLGAQLRTRGEPPLWARFRGGTG